MSTKNFASLKSEAVEVSSSSTEVKSHTSILRWNITDYEFLSRLRKEVQSPEFPEDVGELRKWYLKMRAMPIREFEYKYDRYSTTLGIDIHRKFSEEIDLQVSVWFEKVSGERFNAYDSVIHCNSYTLYIQVVLSTNKLYDALHWDKSSDKSLIITCEIRVFDSIKNVLSKTIPKPFASNDLTRDISTFFYTDQTFKDVTIYVRNKRFEAHKTILAARSKVFAAMFTHEMSEKLNSSFEIKDLEPKTVETMLQFIYTDKVDDLDLKVLVHQLLAAADKYNLERLKEICSAYMQKNMTIENVSRILRVADIYSILDLKNAAVRFVVSHRREVKNRHEFKNLLTERPHLAMELLDIADNSDN